MLVDKIATFERIKQQLADEDCLDDLELLVKYDAQLVAAWDALLTADCASNDDKLKLAAFFLSQIDENVDSTITLEQIKSKILELMASMA